MPLRLVVAWHANESADGNAVSVLIPSMTSWQKHLIIWDRTCIKLKEQVILVCVCVFVAFGGGHSSGTTGWSRTETWPSPCGRLVVLNRHQDWRAPYGHFCLPNSFSVKPLTFLIPQAFRWDIWPCGGLLQWKPQLPGKLFKPNQLPSDILPQCPALFLNSALFVVGILWQQWQDQAVVVGLAALGLDFPLPSTNVGQRDQQPNTQAEDILLENPIERGTLQPVPRHDICLLSQNRTCVFVTDVVTTGRTNTITVGDVQHVIFFTLFVCALFLAGGRPCM